MARNHPVRHWRTALHRAVAAAALSLALPGCTGTPPVAQQTAAADPMAAYLFAYFKGSGPEREKIYFAISEGNDALHWRELNGGRPVLESTKGTRGLRDPFLMRSAEGDRFFLLATDLSVARTTWNAAVRQGSHHLEIWESRDLIDWGEQRHVPVNLPNAGMTWAPEAIWDPSAGNYAVYWASTLYTDGTRTQDDGNGPQMLLSTTRDFRSFTPPRPWIKSADRAELQPGSELIDSSVLFEDGQYHRFTKVAASGDCAVADIMHDRSPSLAAPAANWTLADRCIGHDAGTTELEGPSILKANTGDRSGHRYILFVDRFRDAGLIPLVTDSLSDDVEWRVPADFALPPGARHGTALPITAAERDALLARWGAPPK
ncbi:glycoside hydrolase family 43 protein [Croceibacterium sp. TMG7-5b_MA50]|uniref:glycoside hydrolase family 43 protein n=1 Tax=Croceibacterium sp. TMG7-5b_MA50 TaxID=3121290 RepID=UPI00322148CC